MRRRFVKNALANLSRGGASAVVAILLPPILVRHMSSTNYAVWVLVLQLAAYMSYLDFGLQTAIGRYVAFAKEKGDTEWRDSIFSTAFVALGIAALAGVIVILAILLNVGRIFPSVPASLMVPMRLCMLIVGISTALGLPASALNGVFVGLQRYEVVAITVGAGKLLTAAGLIVSAMTGKSLFFMAAIVAAANLATYLAQFTMMRLLAPDIRFRPELITKGAVRELSGYCASLTVWSFAMLLVNGMDILLVGRFQFGAVTPYSVSATLVAFLAGVQNAIFGVIMPHAAGLSAREDSTALGALLLKTTRFGTLLLLLTGIPLIVLAVPLIKIWIGAQFATEGGKILIVLIAANMIRLTGAPYASILIGTGQQRLVIVGPLMEGVSNLAMSLVLGMKYGAIGVAGGTLIGAVVGVTATVLYNLRRTRKVIRVPTPSYVIAIVTPCLCMIPILAAFCVSRLFQDKIAIGVALTFTMAALIAMTVRELNFRRSAQQ